MDNEKIGLFISELRKEKNLTQKDLGDKLGVTDRAVSRWERGKGCPDISLLDDLSKILEISILEILKGHRLTEEEQIKNKELIETMTYTEANTKKKFTKTFNNLVISIIIFLILLLSFFNIKSLYFMNKTYKSTMDEDYSELFIDIKGNVNLIMNNQGIYTDEEYESILNYVKAINNLNDIEFAKEMMSKTEFTYKDVVTVLKKASIYQIYGYDVSTRSSIYDIIVKYDLDKLENLHKFQVFQTSYMESFEQITAIKELPFFNNRTSKYDGNALKTLIFSQYSSYQMALKDIIEVGDIHE